MNKDSHEEKRFLSILLKILNRLPKRRQNRFWILLAGMILVACLETLVVGILAVYASAIANPEIILKSERLSRIQNVLHLQSLTSMKGLIVFMSIAVTALIGIKNIINGIITYTTKLYSANISCYIGDQLFSGFLNLPYEWHLSRNSADLIQGVAWRQHFGNLLNASMKTLSDILIVAIMLTTLVIVEPIISVLVIIVLGSSALIIFTKVRHLLDTTAIDLVAEPPGNESHPWD
jgi:ABC-type multidrug transport system fused ATPase/permease subunit